MGLHTEYSSDGKQFTIYVKGRFDFNLVQDFRHSYADITERPVSVYVDFRETEYMDSSALGMLLNMRKALGAGPRSIHLINCRPEIRQILEISRFDKIFLID